jgi:hypothetical protein
MFRPPLKIIAGGICQPFPKMTDNMLISMLAF